MLGAWSQELDEDWWLGYLECMSQELDLERLAKTCSSKVLDAHP